MALLDTQPNKDFVTYILQGITNGFYIGYDYSKKVKKASSNLLPAAQNPEVVSRYIQEEVALGRVIRPLQPDLVDQVSVYRLSLGVPVVGSILTPFHHIRN